MAFSSRCIHCWRALFDYYANLSILNAFSNRKPSRIKRRRSSQFQSPSSQVADVFDFLIPLGIKELQGLNVWFFCVESTMKTREGENRKIQGSSNQPLGYVSRRFSMHSRRYKKLATQEELDESRPASSKSRQENTRASTEDFDDFAINRYKGSRDAAKYNAAADDEEEGLDTVKEALPVRCRRHAICEEMERTILNDAGVSLRGYRELLVTRRLLYEMHLL